MMLAKKKLFSDLGYQPHEGQWLVHRSTAKRRVLACGSRWGKTLCAAMEGVAAALEPRESSIGWVAAPNYGLARRVFGRMQVVVMQHLQHRLVALNERERWFQLRNMAGGISEVRAKSCDSSVSLLGEALDWIVLDEAARVQRDVWENALSQRLLDKDGWALLISTPRGTGWFFELYRAGQRGRDPGIESWCQPTRQNPYIDPERIERERSRLTRDAFAEEYEAEFLGADAEPCWECGNPSLHALGQLIVRPGDVVPQCADCGQALDAEGRTLVKKVPGAPDRLNTILLRPDYPEPDLPPSVQLLLQAAHARDFESDDDEDDWE